MLETVIRPRFSDTDALGHINNTVIPVWLLEAREPVLSWFTPDGELERGSLAVVRVEVDYRAETRFGEDVTIETRVEQVGNSSFVLLQDVIQAGQVTASGRTTLVHFDPRSRSARPVPDDIRAQLEQHQESRPRPL